MKLVLLTLCGFAILASLAGCGDGSVSPADDKKVKDAMSHGLSAPGKPVGPKGQSATQPSGGLSGSAGN